MNSKDARICVNARACRWAALEADTTVSVIEQCHHGSVHVREGACSDACHRFMGSEGSRCVPAGPAGQSNFKSWDPD